MKTKSSALRAVSAIGIAVLIVIIVAIAGVATYIALRPVPSTSTTTLSTTSSSTPTQTSSESTTSQSSIETIISGSTTILYECYQNGTTTVTTATTFGGNGSCFIAPNGTFTVEFVVGASGLSASGQVTLSGSANVKFVDVSSNTTLHSDNGVTTSSFSNQALTNGNAYEFEVSNTGSSAITLSGSLTISG